MYWRLGQFPLSVLEYERLPPHGSLVNCVAFAPDSKNFASACADNTARLWHVDSLHQGKVLDLHGAPVYSVSFSPDGSLLATASGDAAVAIWSVSSGSLVRVLEGHTTGVRAVAFSPEGHFLASKSDGGTIRLWRCDLWQEVGRFLEETTTEIVSIGFGRRGRLATYSDKQQRGIRLWRLDLATLLANRPAKRMQYCNAKIVLMGDTGVGKSGLALALTGKPFAATESTHGRRVWPIEESTAELGDDCSETREVLLWDLAGQPAYRLVNQLHLHDTTVALIVFDSRSDTDPFAGVRYWERALRQAFRHREAHGGPVRIVLVAARIDRGRISVSDGRLAQLRTELGIDEADFFATSAKEGWGVPQLRSALTRLIDWDHVPKVTSTELFHDIKAFLVRAVARRPRLQTVASLYDAFVSDRKSSGGSSDIRAEFEACIGRLESRGVVRRLSFGGYVLLEPPLLDFYASAIVEAARDEPDGLGSIGEDDVRRANFRIPTEGRLTDRSEEELLLVATNELLLRSEIALRETTDAGAMLVFPSQSTRDAPEVVGSLRPSLRISFQGSVQSVYATLVVRLARSGVFQRRDIWREGLLMSDSVGALCGVQLRRTGDTGGELDVLVSGESAAAMRAQLEQFIQTHVMKRAVADTVESETIVSCSGCGEMFQAHQIAKRYKQGNEWIGCPVCDAKTTLPKVRGHPVTEVPSKEVITMGRDADLRREYDAATSTIRGKEATSDFDVFMCHHHDDKSEVKKIGRLLRARGYLPWLDEWELPPGKPWIPELERELGSIRAAAIFIGGSGSGVWQQIEFQMLLQEFVKRGRPVIPVILPTATKAADLPLFLRSMTWVDFRVDDPDPMQQLIWGIAMRKPVSSTSSVVT